MAKDPIVEEIHAVREEIARRFNFDLGEIIADVRRRQEASPRRVVRKEDHAPRASGDQSPAEEQKDAA